MLSGIRRARASRLCASAAFSHAATTDPTRALRSSCPTPLRRPRRSVFAIPAAAPEGGIAHAAIHELVSRGARPKRRLTPGLHVVLRRDGRGARAAQERGRHDRGRDPEDPEARSRLARVPGLLRQHRVLPAGRAARRSPRSSSTPSRSTTTRRSWPPPATAPRRTSRRRSRTTRASTSPSSRARSRPGSTAPTARSAAGPPSTSPARSAGTRWPRSPWGPAPRSAGFRRPRRTRRARSASPTPCPGVKNLINLSACPANVENLTALIVYYLTFKALPPTDSYHRPLFAYGKAIHDNCERRAHYDAGQYVEAWGDEGHRTGYCLYKMGCKGPVTFQNCPNVRWNERHELADRLRPPVHRLRRARLLGQDDALLPAPRGHPRLRRPIQHRQGRASGPRSASAPPSRPTASSRSPSAGRRAQPRNSPSLPEKPAANKPPGEKGERS